jgi:hypothetical protein
MQTHHRVITSSTHRNGRQDPNSSWSLRLIYAPPASAGGGVDWTATHGGHRVMSGRMSCASAAHSSLASCAIQYRAVVVGGRPSRVLNPFIYAKAANSTPAPADYLRQLAMSAHLAPSLDTGIQGGRHLSATWSGGASRAPRAEAWPRRRRAIGKEGLNARVSEGGLEPVRHSSLTCFFPCFRRSSRLEYIRYCLLLHVLCPPLGR